MNSVRTKIQPNLLDYEKTLTSFSWENIGKELNGLPQGKGLNIAHEAIDRHSTGKLKDTVAIRFIRKNRSVNDFTYSMLQKQTSKFANVLRSLGIKKGERVFSLAGRIPELYITALGTLKTTAVFCPLFSVFGPEPIFQRMNKGEASVLVTTSALFEKKIKQLMEKLPSLRFIILSDLTEHLSEKVLSWSKLMEQASDEFIIPKTDPEDPALLHFT
ncbi:MAG: AMP-binding protein, partial [Gillisia sp.]|nr:AMP-binding protein [Gillisia sp.]